MLSSLKMRKAGGKSPAVEVAVPAHFRCPISLDVMKDPVTLCTGITYDRQSIEAWLESGNRTCPVTNQALRSSEMIPNHAIRKMIQAWCVENRSKGVERIPTPKVPVSAMEAEQMVLGLGGVGRKEVVRKMERLCRESERNRRCIAVAGAGFALATAFVECSELEVQEEVLQVLTMMLPLDREAKSVLGSSSSVKTLARALQGADLGRRRNSVLMVKELVLFDRARASAMSKVEGVVEGLVKVVKEPICPQTTKASLMAMFFLVSSSESETATAFVDMGLVPLILEMLMGSDRSISEKALGVLDAIFSFEQGREQAANHALTVPVLVKKMFRVSDLATELAVSALWKLCKSCKGGDGEAMMFMECLQVGAFQKVLLLLQVGCREKTKEKASELLKLMNVHRARGECIETIDFKQLKRPF